MDDCVGIVHGEKSTRTLMGSENIHNGRSSHRGPLQNDPLLRLAVCLSALMLCGGCSSSGPATAAKEDLPPATTPGAPTSSTASTPCSTYLGGALDIGH